MTPVIIDKTARPIGAPATWDEARDGKCHTIHVRTVSDGQYRFMESAYEPTTADLARLNAGGKVILGISAPQHPVIRIYTSQPPAADPDTKPLPRYQVSEEIDTDGKRWCRVVGTFGAITFPAGMELKPDGAIDMREAAYRLMGAIEAHAKEQAWI